MASKSVWVLVLAAFLGSAVVAADIEVAGEINIGGVWLSGFFQKKKKDKVQVRYQRENRWVEEWIAPEYWRDQPQIGVTVQVYSNNAWAQATVIKVESGRYLCRCDGREVWVAPGGWRPYIAPVAPVTQVSVTIGTTGQAFWNDKWYDATVLDVRAGGVHVRYNEFGDKYNEWIALDRWKTTPATTTVSVDVQVGARGQAWWKDNWYNATVIKVETGKAYVRYDDYGDKYYDWITFDRWKPAPAPSPVVTKIGVEVLVNNNGVWVKATVIQEQGGRYLCRWGGGEGWFGAGQWKPIERAAAVTITVGTTGQAFWNEKWYKATILRVEAERIYVRYDEYGDKYNDWITLDRWRNPGIVPR